MQIFISTQKGAQKREDTVQQDSSPGLEKPQTTCPCRASLPTLIHHGPVSHCMSTLLTQWLRITLLVFVILAQEVDFMSPHTGFSDVLKDTGSGKERRTEPLPGNNTEWF